MEKVRLGVIGGGRIADLNILGYLDHPRCEIVAVCDRDPEVAARRQKEWGAGRMTTDYREILAAPDIDAVEILTPHRCHHPMVIEAAKAGKHVSVQKPMCVSMKEADEMIEACQKAGVKLKLFENFVFYPPYRRALEIVRAGGIGEPLSINIKLGGGMGGWWVPLKTWLWRLDYEECGGGPTVYDDGFHKLSVARAFFGDVETVRAWIDLTLGTIDSPAMITWRHRDGRLGVWDITASPGMIIKGKYYGADERVELIGTQGYIWVTRCTAQLSEIPPLLHYHDGKTETCDDMRDDWGDSFHDSGHDFIDSLIEDRQPRLSGEDGRELMRFWKAIERSWKEDREVKLSEVTS